MTGEAARAVADELERRGLAAPARLLLDAHRPLAPLIGATATFLTPLVGGVVGRRGSDLLRLLEEPGGIDALIARIDHEAPEAGCRTSDS
jgi:hypothetical protein